MSQTKVDNHKRAKMKRKELQKKKDFHKWMWICAGCIVVGLSVGYLVGKFWIYPNYRESAGEPGNTQSQTGLSNQELQELNRQMEGESED